jgi:hypothetical protein
MIWIARVGYFIAGACLTNAIPHLVAGLMGRLPNSVLQAGWDWALLAIRHFAWGWTNALLGCVLLCQAGSFRAWSAPDVALSLAGSFVTGTILSVHFGNLLSVTSIGRKGRLRAPSTSPTMSAISCRSSKSIMSLIFQR